MSDNVLHSSHLKPMTEPQQRYLKQALSTLPTPKKQTLKAALNTAVFWVFISVGLCVLWFISSLIIAAIVDLDIGISSSYSTFIFSAIIMLAGLFAINSTRKWLRESGSLYSLIQSDLTLKSIKEENYKVLGIKCFKEPEHNGLIYFLKLAASPTLQTESDSLIEDKIRVIYDYESQSKSIESQRLLIVKSSLTILIGVHSDIVLENNFSGTVMTQIDHFDLTIPPERWPSPDSWLSADWQSLETSYAPITLK